MRKNCKCNLIRRQKLSYLAYTMEECKSVTVMNVEYHPVEFFIDDLSSKFKK
jgi:hypothetical protein